MTRVYKGRRATRGDMLLFALLAVAAPIPQFVVYEQCTIVDPARFWCNVLVANYVGDTYCCDTKFRF